ncbi:MAG: translocation/assembly module TamB domain-containing protein [Gemmatimonadetes bacterium]|nr:translocation/assembly module TamB domain-containing protein [Gemmatimonadota bacterium]
MAGAKKDREQGVAGTAGPVRAAHRARRRSPAARFFIWAVLSAAGLCVAGVAGAVVISHTAAGRGLALDWLVSRMRTGINGSLTVGSVSPGGLLGGATFHDIRISDNEGHIVLVVDSVRARYSVADFLGGPPGLEDLQLWSPVVDVAPADGRRIELDSLVVPGGGAFGEEDAGFLIRGGRIHGGTVIARDQEGAVKHIRGVEGRVGRVEVGPGPDPTVVVGVDDLDLSYPQGNGVLELRDIRGTIRARKPTVAMEVEHFELPASAGRGNVHMEWDGAIWSTVFDLDVDHMALADLAWIDERFDRGTARGEVRIATEPSGSRIDFVGGQAELGSASLGFSGAFTVDAAASEVHFEGLTVTPERLPTAELNRWLPNPVEIAGLLTGEVRLDGRPGRLSAAGELALRSGDDGGTLARLSGRGTVLERGAVEDVVLNAEELDYGLLEILVPQVPWTGSGDATVRLDGDLRTGMAVEIAANQSMPDGSSVAVQGTVYGDTAISLVDLQARLEPLSLTTVRDMYPDLSVSGAVSGTVSLSGSLDELEFATDLQTAAGPLAAEGQVNARDLAAGYHIEAAVEEFRLSEFVAELPDSVSLTASATLTGRGLDLESVRAGLVLRVEPSTIGPLEVDSAGLEAWVDEDGILRVESLYAEAGGVGVWGGGTLGTVSAAGDGVTLAVSSASIRPLRDLVMGENLVAWDELLPIEQNIMIEFDGVDPDTFPRARDIRFDGRADGQIRIEGALRDLVAQAEITLEEPEYGQFLAQTLNADLTVSGLGLPAGESEDSAGAAAALREPVVIEGMVTSSSVSFRDREYRFALMEGNYGLGDRGPVRVFIARTLTESYEAQGVVGLREDGGRIDLDRFTVVRDDRRWNLRGPARFEWDPEVVRVRDFGLIRPGTEGLRVRADGLLSRGESESDFDLEIAELDLEVVGSLLQMEAPPSGVVSANLRAHGSGRDPQWAGTLEASDIELGTFSFDRVSANGSYSGRELATRVEAWSGGRRNLRAEGTVPLDLRLATVDRIPDGPVDLRVEADSFPAAMVLGGLDGLEGVAGTVSGDVTLRGRPSALEPDGSLHLRDGEATVAAFGTRLSSAEMNLDLDPSGVVTVDGSAVSGGTLDVRGTVDLVSFQDDVGLELAFWPREFQIVNRLDIEAAVTGDSVVLTNTFNYPLILGSVEVVDATVDIDEFERSAEVVDLYDPVLFSAATVQLGLGAEDDAADERVPFLQNLRLDVNLALGRGNQIRSRNMDATAAGDLSLTFDRAGNQLIVYGDANLIRGTYRLGSRSLRMMEGVFRFPGTPGFDPGISVTAVTRLATCDGEPQEITTNMHGTLLRPYVNIQSDAERTTSESELYNLLILGRCSSTLLGSGGTASVDAGRGYLLSQFGNVIGNQFAREFDLDYLSVSQPDYGLATTALGTSSVQVEVGRYLRDDVFLIGVYRRGYCADPTIPVSSGGMRVEVALPGAMTMESFFEGRCTREQYRGLDDISLQLARIWGFSFFREWGY